MAPLKYKTQLKEMSFSLRRPTPKRFQVRETDVKYERPTPKRQTRPPTWNPYTLGQSCPSADLAEDDNIKEVLWVEQTEVKLLPMHLSLLTELSPILKDRFFSLHRPAPKRFEVRAADVKYECSPREFTEAFKKMLRVVIPQPIPRVDIPPPAVNRANLEQVLWMAVEFKMVSLKKDCLAFLNANYNAFSIRDLVRISEKGQVADPKVIAFTFLFKPQEKMEIRAVREQEPVIRTRLVLLKRTEMDTRYTSSKRFKECPKKDMMNDEKTRAFLLNAIVRRPGSTLRRRELCQDNCRYVDRARRCEVCEHRDAPPKPAINYDARRRALCQNECSLEDGSLRCAVCDHPKPKYIESLEAKRRKLCYNNCSHFDAHNCCTLCDHPRRMDDARRKALCRNECSVFDDASGRCTTCNHPFGVNSILDLDEKRWKLCRNRCASFDVYNCCVVCEYPRQPTPALKKDLCNDKCYKFVKTSGNKTICVVCCNELVKGHHTYKMSTPENSSSLATVPLVVMTPYHTGIY